MIGCQNDDCKSKWFHPKCLGIIKIPDKDEAWFCPDCREIPGIKKKIRKLEEGKGKINGLTKVNLDCMKIAKPKQTRSIVKAKG